MSTSPAATALTVPLDDTVAIDRLLLSHVDWLVTVWVVPSLSVAVAVAWTGVTITGVPMPDTATLVTVGDGVGIGVDGLLPPPPHDTSVTAANTEASTPETRRRREAR